jgi:K(+)-stimulated pyrophosphate-energized sodium pump
MMALYKGFIVSAILSAILLFFITNHVVGMETSFNVNNKTFTGLSLFYCGLGGLIITGLIIWVTEYYTGTNYRPVQSIAKASTTGHGTNVIQGLAISLEAAALPAIIIVAGILMTYSLAGLFGIAIAVTTMLALAGMVVALDAYGPVTDNAGGIAEMADLDESVRKTTDALDAVGNTTKAVTKGYAIGSAGLGALVTALVVFPTASKASVVFLTFFGRLDISAMPPALSVTGPYASKATTMPANANIVVTAMAIPNNPAM